MEKHLTHMAGGRNWANVPVDKPLQNYAMQLVWEKELKEPSGPLIYMWICQPEPRRSRINHKKGLQRIQSKTLFMPEILRNLDVTTY